MSGNSERWTSLLSNVLIFAADAFLDGVYAREERINDSRYCFAGRSRGTAVRLLHTGSDNTLAFFELLAWSEFRVRQQHPAHELFAVNSYAVIYYVESMKDIRVRLPGQERTGMIDMDTVMNDLKLLVNEVNCMREPMTFSDCTLDIKEKRKDFLSVSVVVTRNTGGSPESDYIVQDNVDIEVQKDGTICASFYKEMLICDTKTCDDWKNILQSIRKFFIHD